MNVILSNVGGTCFFVKNRGIISFQPKFKYTHNNMENTYKVFLHELKYIKYANNIS